jgi:hypothetical protein
MLELYKKFGAINCKKSNYYRVEEIFTIKENILKL